MSKRLVFSIVSFLIIAICFFVYLNFQKTQHDPYVINFHRQIGIYSFDLQRTKLGSYIQDSTSFSNLKIEFRSDSTFVMNMKVPFLYDSIGKWIPGGGGAEDWNRLFFENWKYGHFDQNSGNHFTQPWTIDSIFYINAATPQTGNESIQEIYFRKIGR